MSPLPPGQFELGEFPRFGLTQFAKFKPVAVMPASLMITGNVVESFDAVSLLGDLPRRKMIADFHCVTTWSATGLHWEGVLFRDFYEKLVQPNLNPGADIFWVISRGADKFKARLPLTDMMADDVMIADRLNGEPLAAEHGGPLRLIAPAHYGYKNTKFVQSLEFLPENTGFRFPAPQFMEHPRARVTREERGRWFPGWMLRYIYRPVVRPTVKRYKRYWNKPTN